MNDNIFELNNLAQSYTNGSQSESINEVFEQESRRYSRQLEEEQEARLR